MAAQTTESIMVALIQDTRWDGERVHTGVTIAKSIIPKELRVRRTNKSRAIAQEYHSVRFSIALGSRIMEDVIGPSARDERVKMFRAKFEHVLFYRTSKGNLVGFSRHSQGDPSLLRRSGLAREDHPDRTLFLPHE